MVARQRPIVLTYAIHQHFPEDPASRENRNDLPLEVHDATSLVRIGSWLRWVNPKGGWVGEKYTSAGVTNSTKNLTS